MTDDTKYLVNQALVEHLWKQYEVKKDPRWLAEICLNVPFFDKQQVGQEIARLLENSSIKSIKLMSKQDATIFGVFGSYGKIAIKILQCGKELQRFFLKTIRQALNL